MKEQIAITVIALSLVFSFIALDNYWHPAHAAPAAKQQPEPCVEIAVIGQIHTFQCETLQGQPYLQNSMGFMTALP